MARPYDDDLRRKFLQAYDRGEGSIGMLATRFGVSRGWGWKISSARNRSGQMERVVGRQGRPAKVTPEVLSTLSQWVAAKPDLTLAQLQEKLRCQLHFQLSIGRLWQLLKKLGLRLKKSRSTPPSGTPQPTRKGAKSLSQRSRPLRRSG